MNIRVACIMKFIEKLGYSELAEYLITNKFATEQEVFSAVHTQERAELIFTSLKKAESEEKLLLLDFEWKMLPLEQIKITCLSTREERHFTYGY